ncbi:Transposon TX1 uncharacterized 149 kDa protein [Vitis vinifera]|uniref:Transposon TX1 uncharacterized 149 kDa protein n=1 Tax=Vitis vinifera TaxID=29760 RepID=A0A438GP76_VITVI|nr:Transposon TX1 uncharacterized 149 kDa protein [Vitis vinifera]
MSPLQELPAATRSNAHRRRNFMAKLRVDGVMLDGEDDIKEAVTNAFQRILEETGEWRLSIDGLVFDSLQLADSEALETPFSEEEVLVALSNLSGDKAPGPDGFSLAFWQQCWDFVKLEKGGANDPKDFRPISLVGGLYKLLAKVLANRLKKLLGSLVSDFQHAFVAGRQILDVVLIANETIDSKIKEDLRGVLCKLDIKKAYDHVNWNFVLAVTEKMGFGSKWMGWIR